MLAAVFPIKAFSLDENVSWLKTLSNRLTFHGGVLLLSPIKYENLWMWYYLTYLHILVKLPTASLFFCDYQLHLNLLYFLCREMSNASWRVYFQYASSPKGHTLCVLSGGRWNGMEQDGTQTCFSAVSRETWKLIVRLCATSLCRQLDPWQGLTVPHFRRLENFPCWFWFHSILEAYGRGGQRRVQQPTSRKQQGGLERTVCWEGRDIGPIPISVWCRDEGKSL